MGFWKYYCPLYSPVKGKRLFYQFDSIHEIFPIKNVAVSERTNATLLISCKLLRLFGF
jgi:hypothetical protein